MVKGGYGQITDGLARNLDIHLNTPVSHIAITENGVVVNARSGQLSSSTPKQSMINVDKLRDVLVIRSLGNCFCWRIEAIVLTVLQTVSSGLL